MSKSLYQTNVESRAPTSSDAGVIGNWWIDTSVTPADLYLYTASNTWTKQNNIKTLSCSTFNDMCSNIRTLVVTNRILGVDVNFTGNFSQNGRTYNITLDGTVTTTTSNVTINKTMKFSTASVNYEEDMPTFIASQTSSVYSLTISSSTTANIYVQRCPSGAYGTDVTIPVRLDIDSTNLSTNFSNAIIYYI